MCNCSSSGFDSVRCFVIVTTCKDYNMIVLSRNLKLEISEIREIYEISLRERLTTVHPLFILWRSRWECAQKSIQAVTPENGRPGLNPKRHSLASRSNCVWLLNASGARLRYRGDKSVARTCILSSTSCSFDESKRKKEQKLTRTIMKMVYKNTFITLTEWTLYDS